LIFLLHLEARPEPRLGFPRGPVLLREPGLCVIRHPPELHVRVTPYALDRSFHAHRSQKTASSVTRPSEL